PYAPVMFNRGYGSRTSQIIYEQLGVNPTNPFNYDERLTYFFAFNKYMDNSYHGPEHSFYAKKNRDKLFNLVFEKNRSELYALTHSIPENKTLYGNFSK